MLQVQIKDEKCSVGIKYRVLDSFMTFFGSTYQVKFVLYILKLIWICYIFQFEANCSHVSRSSIIYLLPVLPLFILFYLSAPLYHFLMFIMVTSALLWNAEFHGIYRWWICLYQWSSCFQKTYRELEGLLLNHRSVQYSTMLVHY